MATERSLERCGVDALRPAAAAQPRPHRLLAARPSGRACRRVRDAGLTRLLGVAPGPANGFTLDLIDCFERFGELIDWAMIILNPLEPWPGELALDAAAARTTSSVITRVVDYGGLFHDDVLPGPRLRRATTTARSAPPAGSRQGRDEARADASRSRTRHGLTHAAARLRVEPRARRRSRCVAPTLIQESRRRRPPIEDKRAELAAVTRRPLPLTAEEVEAIGAIGENRGCMALKGASPDYAASPRADRWELNERAARASPARWQIDPQRDLRGPARGCRQPRMRRQR